MNKYSSNSLIIHIDTLFRKGSLILNEREKYWVKLYDSHKNGYNSTPGGNQTANYKYPETWINEMYEDYINGMSYKRLAEKYNVSVRYIDELLGENKIKNRKTKIERVNKNIKISMFNKDYSFLMFFDSIKDSIVWIQENTDYRINSFNGYTYISKSATNGNIAYGRRWQFYNNELSDEENKIYKNKPLDYENKKVKKLNKKNKTKNVSNKKRIKKENNCQICGKKINIESKLCLKCFKEKKRSNIPSVEVLIDLISKYSFEEIGEQYGVTGKAVRKWCDSYGIKEHQKYDNNGTFCKTLNIEFKTFVEAAKYLIENGYSKANNLKSLANHISESKKSGKPINGLIFI